MKELAKNAVESVVFIISLFALLFSEVVFAYIAKALQCVCG